MPRLYAVLLAEEHERLMLMMRRLSSISRATGVARRVEIEDLPSVPCDPADPAGSWRAAADLDPPDRPHAVRIRVDLDADEQIIEYAMEGDRAFEGLRIRRVVERERGAWCLGAEKQVVGSDGASRVARGRAGKVGLNADLERMRDAIVWALAFDQGEPRLRRALKNAEFLPPETARGRPSRLDPLKIDAMQKQGYIQVEIAGELLGRYDRQGCVSRAKRQHERRHDEFWNAVERKIGQTRTAADPEQPEDTV
jgi:hypothetical protein